MASPSPQSQSVTLELRSSQPVVDYDRLAGEHGGAPADTLDALAQQFGGAAEAPESSAQDAPMVGAAKFWARINPIAAAYALYQVGGETLRGAGAAAIGDQAGAARHFKAGPGQMLEAQGRAYQRAQQRAAAGDYVGAAAQTAAWLIPLIGPMLSEDSELLREGKYWEAAGGMLGGDLAVTAPLPLGGRKVQAGLPGMKPSAPVADAVAWAERQGIQPSASTATGNPVVLAAEHIADRSLGGTLIAQPKFQAHTEALQRVGGELADRAYPVPVTPETAGGSAARFVADVEQRVGDAYGRTAGTLQARVHPSPVTPEQAGTGLTKAVEGQVTSHAAKANAAYTRLREIEASPEATFEITAPQGTASTGPAPARFAPEGAGVADVFQGVLAEARRTGYRGSAQALHERFLAKFDEVKALTDMQRGAIFEAIRSYGGLNAAKESAGGMAGELKQLWENSTGLVDAHGFTRAGKAKKAWTRTTGGFKVGDTHYPAVLRKEGGLSLDDMATQLRQDAEWGHITGPSELLEAIDQALTPTRRNRQAAVVYGESDLAAVGVEPGRRWWSDTPDVVPDAPLPTMQLPVDLRGVKEALRPLYDRLRETMPLTQQQASPGLLALKNLLDRPDFVPASVADADLGAIKSIVREAESPSLRTRSQGIAARAVAELEAEVRAAVERPGGEVGAEASARLTEGRQATVAKYKAADLLESLRDEPVQVYGHATWAHDAGSAKLRQLARQAPGEMRKIGRALVDELLTPATRGGRFTIEHAATMQRRWQAIGPETRKILIPDAALVRQFDRFFDELAKVRDRGATVTLPAEPVGVYRQLVAPKDGNIELLRGVARVSPASLRPIGRAFLDELLATATRDGGFTRVDGIFKTWMDLGAETKRLVYRDAGLVRDIDRFMLYAKKSAAMPNPSGTAHVTMVGAGLAYLYTNPATGLQMQIGGAALAKLLHSPAGVRALTRGLSIPISNRLAATAVAAEITHLARGDAQPVEDTQ